MKKYTLAWSVSLLLCSSCDLLTLSDEPPATPRASFEYLWKECRDKYAFFDYKQVDWDAVYRTYSPKVHDRISQDSLFRVLFDMLLELKDGHVNLISPFNVSRFEVSLLGPRQIDERVILEHYLGNYYTTGPFLHTALADGKVGYIRYASFSNRVNDFELNFVFSRYARAEGLILDLRQNGGGSIENVFTILNRLVTKKTLLYHSYLKNGPGKEDFGPATPAYATPPDDRDLLRYTRKVIVLVDRGSYSAASFFALATKALPEVVLMGDYTGGGLGIPNGGQLPNGWTYRLSVSRTLSPDGANYENGVPPDIPASLDTEALRKGVDSIVERAIREITK